MIQRLKVSKWYSVGELGAFGFSLIYKIYHVKVAQTDALTF